MWKIDSFDTKRDLINFCNSNNILPQYCHIVYNSYWEKYQLFYFE